MTPASEVYSSQAFETLRDLTDGERYDISAFDPSSQIHHQSQLMTWTTFWDWLMGLGRDYGVNPVIFAAIYVGAIPFFMLSVAWIVRNLRWKRSILVPALSASFFFISAYLYLLVAGRGIPAWVYVIIVFIVAGGGYNTLTKIRKQSHSKHVDAHHE